MQNQQQHQKVIVLVEILVMVVEVIEIVHVVWMVLHQNEIERIEQTQPLTMRIKITRITIVCNSYFVER